MADRLRRFSCNACLAASSGSAVPVPPPDCVPLLTETPPQPYDHVPPVPVDRPQPFHALCALGPSETARLPACGLGVQSRLERLEDEMGRPCHTSSSHVHSPSPRLGRIRTCRPVSTLANPSPRSAALRNQLAGLSFVLLHALAEQVLERELAHSCRVPRRSRSSIPSKCPGDVPMRPVSFDESVGEFHHCRGVASLCSTL